MFAAMQQSSATLIYDVDTMKDTVHGELPWKNSTAPQNSTVPSL